ncbi:MAG: hypothetical protein CL843_00600 [Crocinitomicaceae bacterium]|nr:hypothetical protein [Crocinitomicaceae bacterium]|tara:strand:- start:3560 stop:5434 length:1875 start_codon:yes stop_codon:yes gene_type:complete
MKIFKALLFCFSLVQVTMAQELPEQKIATEVNAVTVFLKDAQVTRKKSVQLPAGKSIVRFTGLSPFIKAQSVQVKGQGSATLLSIQHTKNYTDKLAHSAQLDQFNAQLENIEEQLQMVNTRIEIVQEEIAFLKNNSTISGKNEAVTTTELKNAATFYGSQLSSLKFKAIDYQKEQTTLRQQKSDLENEIQQLTGKEIYSSGEVVVKIETKSATRITFELTYVVENASWYPTYDIRAKSVDQPLQMVYKANVRQNTQVDWKNVTLEFSTADPNVSGTAPELRPYYMDFYSRPPSYNSAIAEVSGTVYDQETNEPLPFANVVVKGTTVGATTDLDGHYSLAIPNGATELEYSYVGYRIVTKTIHNDVMNVHLTPSTQALNNVVIQTKRVSGISIQNIESQGLYKSESYGWEDNDLRSQEVNATAHPTNIHFEVKDPYTISSENKVSTITIAQYNVPAEYQYYSVPKVNEAAYLMATLTDWEQYNFLDGEASIFFEGTYVGKTVLQAPANDTLQFSLGQDKALKITREKQKNSTTKQLLGNKKEETLAWQITVKNTKAIPVNIIIYDQIPVPVVEEITVELLEQLKAKYAQETGELQWEFRLLPSETKTLDLRYAVKYPKNKSLMIE